MAAKPILEKGCCRRVGDGSSIRIFSNRWLPNHPTNKVLVPLYEEAEVRTVSELIDPEQKEWRREFIMANFHCDDANAICHIPLIRWSVMDSIVWLHNKKGVYSVKSGYHVARQIMRDGDVAESSSGPTGQFVWAKLWNLHVPTKIKVFGWRTCQDILPTRVNLVKRKIITDNTCECYKRAPETGIHVLWECGVA